MGATLGAGIYVLTAHVAKSVAKSVVISNEAVSVQMVWVLPHWVLESTS